MAQSKMAYSGSRFFRLIDGSAAGLALVAGCAVLGLTLLIGFDIVARRLLGFSIQGTDELGGYTLALVGSLGLSYTLLQRGHPRIDVLLRFLPVRLRAGLHCLAYIALAGFALFMAVHAYEELTISVRFHSAANTPLQTPLWIPQLLWVIGTGFFALTATGCAASALGLFVRDVSEADRTYGTLTAADEVRAYIQDSDGGGADHARH